MVRHFGGLGESGSGICKLSVWVRKWGLLAVVRADRKRASSNPSVGSYQPRPAGFYLLCPPSGLLIQYFLNHKAARLRRGIPPRR